MNLVIPTYRRLNDQKTWDTLAPKLREQVTFVVRPDEVKHFKIHYAPSKVIATAPEVHDFSSTLQFVFDTFADRKFIYMDDDIKGFYRRDRFYQDHSTLIKPWQTTKLETAEDQTHMFNELLKDLEIPFTGSVGLRQAWLPPYDTSRRSAQCNVQLIAVNGALVKKMGWRWDRMVWCSDYDFNLQMNNDGYDTLQRGDFYYTEPGFFNGEGGSNAQLEREARILAMQAAYDNLAKHWPNVLKKSKPREWSGGVSDTQPNPYRMMRMAFLKKRRKELGIA